MTQPDEPAQILSWRAHPAREHLGRAGAGAVVILALAILSGLLMQSVWWALIAAIVLVAALNRFFFPSRYVIDEQGITARYAFRRQRLQWNDLRRFAHDGRGAYLSSRARRSWLDAHRGLHILFGEKRDAVVTLIRERLPKGGGTWAT